MRRVGIITNPQKDCKLKITSSIIAWLEQNNCEVYTEKSLAELLGRQLVLQYDNIKLKTIDFIIVLGGDGTILDVAGKILDSDIPILGVNMGRLGFLAEVEVSEVFDMLSNIMAGRYCTEERLMLRTELYNDSILQKTLYSLNEIGISRGTLPRIITIDAYINGDYVNTYNADGVIVATPTGSTAYSLSAGGPIVSPTNNIMLLTPICPHSLNSRTIVVSDNDIIKLVVGDSREELFVTSDSQQCEKLKSGDFLVIKKASFKTKLIKVSGLSFYDVLRVKLKER